MRAFRLGLISPEFQDGFGGMGELTRGLATALAETDEVTVYSPGRRPTARGPFLHSPALTGDGLRDLDLLRGMSADVWLGLNAGLMRYAAGLHEPFLCYCHGNDFLQPFLACGPPWFERMQRPYAGPLRHALRRLAIRRGTREVVHFFTNSRNTARLMERRLGIPGDRISICPPGVHEDFFQDKEVPNPGPLRILTVCNMFTGRWRKNIEGVLHALRLLGTRIDARYTIVGDGDDRPRLEKLATQLGLADRVCFAGSVPHENLLALYRNSDVFVLASKASRTDVEGFGIVYLEASASGVPVICSLEGGAVDAVEDGVNGIVIPSSSPEDIACGVEFLARNRDKFPPEKVRSFAEQFHWRASAARIRERLAVSIAQ